MKTKLLINPSAGRGKAEKIFPKIESSLRERNVDFSYDFSKSAEHLSELVMASLSSGLKNIVICGGDGSVHQVLNRIIQHPDTILGIIPCGTGDDFAHNIGVPSDVERACDIVAKGKTKRVDTAKIGELYYGCVASVGFDAEVNRFANEIRYLKGTAVYVAAVLKTLINYVPKKIKISYDDGTYENEIMFAAVGNSTSYGGGMKIAPDAKLDDGILDITVVEKIGKINLLKAFPSVFRGEHVHSPYVKTFRSKRVRITSEHDMEVFADGEYMSNLPIEIEVLPGALTVIVP